MREIAEAARWDGSRGGLLEPRPARRRRRADRSAFRDTLNRAVLILAAGGLCAGYLALSDTKSPPTYDAALSRLNHALVALGLGIEDVSVDGIHRTSPQQVFASLAVDPWATLATFDRTAAVRRLEDLPAVETAAIDMVIPNRLVVHIVERQPAAVWRLGALDSLIDATGRVIETDETAVAKAAAGLPLLTGPAAAPASRALLELLGRHKVLAPRLLSCERVDDRRWTLHLRDNVDILLPADGADDALTRFEALNRELGRDTLIDLRAAGRVIVSPRPQLARAP